MAYLGYVGGTEYRLPEPEFAGYYSHDNERLQNSRRSATNAPGGSGPNPAAVVSWHQVGQAVDFNTMRGNFDSIQNEMTNQGLTWGGNFRTPDPVHFQLPAAGQRPTSAMVDACGG